MKLTVFKKDLTHKVITLFDKMKFDHFVDGIHIADSDYLRKNYSNLPHRLVYLREINNGVELNFGLFSDYEKPDIPDFIIYFNEFEELDMSDWFFLQTYFERLFNGLELPMITRRREFLLETGARSDPISWGIFVLLINR